MESIITIRKSNLEDYKVLKELNFKIDFMHINMRSDIIHNNISNLTIEEYTKILYSNKKLYYVAEYKNKIVGFCLIRKCKYKNHPSIVDMSIIEIEKIYVLEQYRHFGIAALLFEQIDKYAKSQSCKMIELSVWGWNTEAIEFYKHLGMNERYLRMEYKIL